MHFQWQGEAFFGGSFILGPCRYQLLLGTRPADLRNMRGPLQDLGPVPEAAFALQGLYLGQNLKGFGVC